MVHFSLFRFVSRVIVIFFFILKSVLQSLINFILGQIYYEANCFDN